MEYHQKEYWISPYNFADQVQQNLNLPSAVKIHDGTLRDGEQTPGLVFSEDDKVAIAELLNEAGVDRIEAGMPAVSEADFNAIKRITSRGLSAEIYAFCRAANEDIDLAKDSGVDGVVIEIPTSEPKLKYQFPKWTEEDIIQISSDTIRYAKSKGLKVVYFGYDTTRARWPFLEKLYSTIKAAGPDSIGIVDTVGCILPDAVKMLVQDVKSLTGLPIEIHVHNDLGMATANSLAAVTAGAEVVHVCVGGLGERSGNACLDEIATGLNLFYGLAPQIKLDAMTSLSRKVQALSNYQLAPNKPITGEHAYFRESGIGIEFVLKQPTVMFSIDPALVGNRCGVLLGKKSGLQSIEVKLDELKLPSPPTETKKKLLSDIKSEAIRTKKVVSDERFKEMVASYQTK